MPTCALPGCTREAKFGGIEGLSMEELGLCEQCFSDIYPVPSDDVYNIEKACALQKVLEEKYPQRYRASAPGLCYDATPLLAARRIDSSSEIPPCAGIDELFMMGFKMGDKDYTVSLTRADASRLVAELDTLLGESEE